MDSAPERLIRELNDHNDSNSEDLISNLPDCILAHILSKLSTKFAVGTAILSTRWKHLFASILQPDIDLDDSLIIHSENNSELDLQRRLQSFRNFNNRLFKEILKEVPSIRKFTLNCTRDYEYDEDEVLGWVSAAVNRSVVILDIKVSLNFPDGVFRCISGSTSLLSLILRHHWTSGRTNPPCCVPNLRCILLDSVAFFADDEIPLILSAFPMLQSLTMRHCSYYQMDVVNVISHSLKDLFIESCVCNDGNSFNCFELNAPALEKFTFNDSVQTKFVFKNLNSVRFADLSVRPKKVGRGIEGILAYNQDVAEFVTTFSNVETLCLSRDTISALQKSDDLLPMFSNLIRFVLGGFDEDGWKLLPQLLETAPKLEQLSITEEIYAESGCFNMFRHNLYGGVPACLLSTLKKSVFKKFKGKIDEILLIGYFLIVGKVLNMVEIISDMPLETVKSILENAFDTLQKASEKCEIIVGKVR